MADIQTQIFGSTTIPDPVLSFLAQLSPCAYMITFRKPYIAGLKIWTFGLLGVCKSGRLDFGPFDCNLIEMDDYPTDGCAISSTAFLFQDLIQMDDCYPLTSVP